MQDATRRVKPVTGRMGLRPGMGIRAAVVLALACPFAFATDPAALEKARGSGPATIPAEDGWRPASRLPGRGRILEEFGSDAQAADAGSHTEASSTSAAGPAERQDQQVIQRRWGPSAEPRAPDDQHLVQRPERSLGSWSIWDSLPLLAVLALIGGVALVIKRSMPARRMLGGGGVLLVLARLPLSAKQSLMLVKMGRQLILLGVSPDRIHALNVVTDPDQVAAMIGEVASNKKDSMSQVFSQAISEESKAYAASEEDAPAVPSASGQVKGLLDKVRGLARGRGGP